MSAPHYHKSLDRYYIGKNESQWCVSLYIGNEGISELWPEDDEPDTDDKLPSEVLDLIEARLKRYLFKSGRDASLAKIAKMRETLAQADREWLEGRVEQARTALAEWEYRLESAKETA